MCEKIFKNLDDSLGHSLQAYKKRDGYKDLEKVLSKKPEQIFAEIADCQLHGRGGAGFCTVTKWSFMPKPTKDKPNYLICNADEGEPGTFKDRDILNNEPHLLIEGIILAAHTLQVRTCYVYVRGEYIQPAENLKVAINEAKEEGLLKNIDIIVHMGAGGYICGEETALIESLEGKRGQPRVKPPYPAQEGLYGCPTIVNNVETLAIMGQIIKKGVAWWKTINSKIFCVSGDVEKPCNIELPLGTSLKEIIKKAGGVKGGWDNLQAVFPGGSSSQILNAKECQNLNMDYEQLKQVGSTLGTAGIIVVSKDTDLGKVVLRFAKFYRHETCGKCTPCREGIPWVYNQLKSIVEDGYTLEKIEQLELLMAKIEGKALCAFADGAIWPIQSFLQKFKKSN